MPPAGARIEWKFPEPNDNKCVITGCDNSHEWMLPWWWKHYSSCNKYDVMFADFGMSSTMLEWCRERGEIIPLRFNIRKNWFKKPFSLLGSPYHYSVWVDLDCEVRKPLDPIFVSTAERGFAVTEDLHNPWIDTPKVLASGVVGSIHGNPIILEWSRRCLSPGKARGDQEVLNALLVGKYGDITIMPLDYQWLRIAGDNNPDAVIMHWTGTKGKNHIRRKMGMKPVQPAHQPSTKKPGTGRSKRDIRNKSLASRRVVTKPQIKSVMRRKR